MKMKASPRHVFLSQAAVLAHLPTGEDGLKQGGMFLFQPRGALKGAGLSRASL